MAKVIEGTQLKLLVNIEPIGTLTMKDMDFTVNVFNGNKTITLTKAECKPERDGEDGYRVPFDTAQLGLGRVKVRVTAILPDGDFIGGTRKEITELNTGIDVVKGL